MTPINFADAHDLKIIREHPDANYLFDVDFTGAELLMLKSMTEQELLHSRNKPNQSTSKALELINAYALIMHAASIGRKIALKVSSTGASYEITISANSANDNAIKEFAEEATSFYDAQHRQLRRPSGRVRLQASILPKKFHS